MSAEPGAGFYGFVSNRDTHTIDLIVDGAIVGSMSVLTAASISTDERAKFWSRIIGNLDPEEIANVLANTEPAPRSFKRSRDPGRPDVLAEPEPRS